MHAKKGFTLIELLVVIAIIAILAAILFPVFANARDKARQISDLSNIKQIALGVVMYTNDYDDTYPIGEVPTATLWNSTPEVTNWVLEIAPYISGADVHIFYGPNDTNAGNVAKADNGTYGVQISVGVNALDGPDPTKYTAANGAPRTRFGVFAPTSPITSGNGDSPTTEGYYAYANSPVCKLAEVTQPSATILLADEQSSDLAKIETIANLNSTYGAGYYMNGIGNASAQADFSLIGNGRTGVWAGTTTTATFLAANNYYELGYNDTNPYFADSTNIGVGGLWQIPSNLRSATNAYPAGPSGIVSSPFSSKTMSNFAYTDGHAKALKPGNTNPDGTVVSWNSTANTETYDPNNQWLVNR